MRVAVAAVVLVLAIVAVAAAEVWPHTTAREAAVGHRTKISGGAVAIDRGHAVVAGIRDDKVRLARLDRYGRAISTRTLRSSGGPDSVDVAISGNRVAVAWRESEAIVLARTGLKGGKVTIDRLTGRGADFPHVAINQQGTALVVFKDAPDFDPTGVGGLLAPVGQPARRIEIAPVRDDNRNRMDVQTDAAGGFHVTWVSNPSYDNDTELQGHADAGPDGVFGPPVEDRTGGFSIAAGTADDGSQVLALVRKRRLELLRRTPGGSWGGRTSIGKAGLDDNVQLAVAPGGATLVAWGGQPDGLGRPGVLRAAVRPRSGSHRSFSLGRASLDGVVTDARGRGQVLSEATGTVVRSTTVDLKRRRAGKTRRIVSGCFFGTTVDDLRDGRVAGDRDGRLVLNLYCGRGEDFDEATVRAPGP